MADAIDVALRVGIPLKIAARMPLQQSDSWWVAEDWVYYRDQVKPKLDNSLVEFVGEVNDQEKGELLKDASALLFPINWPEPFGLVMIEAMACGTPVIAYPCGSVPEIMEDGVTGFVVPDAESAVRAVQRIPEIDRAACRQRCEERFSASRMTSDYLSIYERLIGGEPEPLTLTDGVSVGG